MLICLVISWRHPMLITLVSYLNKVTQRHQPKSVINRLKNAKWIMTLRIKIKKRLEMHLRPCLCLQLRYLQNLSLMHLKLSLKINKKTSTNRNLKLTESGQMTFLPQVNLDFISIKSFINSMSTFTSVWHKLEQKIVKKKSNVYCKNSETKTFTLILLW